MGIVEKLRAYRPIDETSRLIVDAATEIERLQQGAEIMRDELKKARHDLMVRETERRAMVIKPALPVQGDLFGGAA